MKKKILFLGYNTRQTKLIKFLKSKKIIVKSLGQKKLLLNNGSEYIRLTGLIRPEDISANNVVASSRIANAKISYLGAGEVADTAKRGWLSSLFSNISPL